MSNITDLEENILTDNFSDLEIQESMADKTNEELMDIIIQLINLLRWYNKQIQLGTVR